MEHDVTHDLDRRLRAARPAAARIDENAFDADLLTGLRDQPIARRRSVPRAVAVPVAAGVTLTATAVVMFGGGPGEVGGPSSAAAITQALHWLSPPSGTILHARSVESQGGRTTTREFWQSADDPASARLRVGGSESYETVGDSRYDPGTDTIHVGGAPPKGQAGGGRAIPPGDPIVAKVKVLLQEGHLEVTGREVHDGTEAWKIALRPDAGRPVWKLWVATADGKPLELRDPGRDANEAPQVIRWPTYEVLPGAGADKLLTLKGAHPTADVVND
jgi:hypothetical protein